MCVYLQNNSIALNAIKILGIITLGRFQFALCFSKSYIRV